MSLTVQLSKNIDDEAPKSTELNLQTWILLFGFSQSYLSKKQVKFLSLGSNAIQRNALEISLHNKILCSLSLNKTLSMCGVNWDPFSIRSFKDAHQLLWSDASKTPLQLVVIDSDFQTGK